MSMGKFGSMLGGGSSVGQRGPQGPQGEKGDDGVLTVGDGLSLDTATHQLSLTFDPASMSADSSSENVPNKIASRDASGETHFSKVYANGIAEETTGSGITLTGNVKLVGTNELSFGSTFDESKIIIVDERTVNKPAWWTGIGEDASATYIHGAHYGKPIKITAGNSLGSGSLDFATFYYTDSSNKGLSVQYLKELNTNAGVNLASNLIMRAKELQFSAVDKSQLLLYDARAGADDYKFHGFGADTNNVRLNCAVSGTDGFIFSAGNATTPTTADTYAQLKKTGLYIDSFNHLDDADSCITFNSGIKIPAITSGKYLQVSNGRVVGVDAPTYTTPTTLNLEAINEATAGAGVSINGTLKISGTNEITFGEAQDNSKLILRDLRNVGGSFPERYTFLGDTDTGVYLRTSVYTKPILIECANSGGTGTIQLAKFFYNNTVNKGLYVDYIGELTANLGTTFVNKVVCNSDITAGLNLIASYIYERGGLGINLMNNTVITGTLTMNGALMTSSITEKTANNGVYVSGDLKLYNNLKTDYIAERTTGANITISSPLKIPALTVGNYLKVGTNGVITADSGTIMTGFSNTNGNILLGANAGSSYTSANTNNFCVFNPGGAIDNTASTNNLPVIRIGTHNQVFGTYIAGITNSTSPPVEALPVKVLPSTGRLYMDSSSRRFKENIVPMEDTSYIYNFNPVNFNYKSDETHSKHYGLIAEDVEQYCPGIVAHDAEGNVAGFNTGAVQFMMLNEMKKQKQQIDLLTAKLAEMEARLNAVSSGTSNVSYSGTIPEYVEKNTMTFYENSQGHLITRFKTAEGITKEINISTT